MLSLISDTQRPKKHSDDQPLLVKQSVHLRGLMFHPFGEEIGNDLFHSFISEP